MNIVICSGGTGGHMFPACSLFEKIKLKGYSATVITDDRGDTFCKDIHGSDKVVVETIRFSYRKIFSIIFSFFSIFIKFFRMWLRDPPDAIIGFGGLFTVIPALAAKLCGSKVVVYEQNSIIGKANKFISRFADLKLSSFYIGEDWKHVSPIVRKEFLKEIGNRYSCDDKIKIVVIGGSQGAMSFDSIIPAALFMLDKDLRKNIEIVQQVGAGNAEKLSKVYESIGIRSTLVKFIFNIAEMMANSQLVICRSGASTLSELSAIGRPAILVPYPMASDNHQFYNAVCYEKKGAAWLLEENENVSTELAAILSKILRNRELLKQAASNIINNSAGSAAEGFIRSIECILECKS